MVSDVLDVFLDTDEHAETVTYLAIGKPSKEIAAVVVPAQDISEEAQQDGMVAVAEWRVLIASDADDGIANPQFGDRIELANDRTVVVRGRERNGFGGHTLMCVEVKVTEKGREYRMTR